LESKSNGSAEREQIAWRFFFKTEQNSLIWRLKLELDKEKSSTGGNSVVGGRSNEEIWSISGVWIIVDDECLVSCWGRVEWERTPVQIQHSENSSGDLFPAWRDSRENEERNGWSAWVDQSLNKNCRPCWGLENKGEGFNRWFGLFEQAKQDQEEL